MIIGKEMELIEFILSTSETKESIISISSILNKHGKGILSFGKKIMEKLSIRIMQTFDNGCCRETLCFQFPQPHLIE